MKKLSILLGCLLMSIGLVACSGNQPVEEQPTEPTVNTVKLDCFEFDIENSTFTEKILLSINLTDNFIVTPKESLMYKDPTYYIGDFKKKDEAGNSIRTIQVYEYTNADFNISRDASKISNNWSISNESLINTSAYIRTFYCSKDGYVVALDIVNNTKEPLSIEDSLQLITFMTGEETHEPTQEEQQSVTVEGTKDSPAKQGEWISTTVFNQDTQQYEPICICINNVYTGEIAQEYVRNVNNILRQDYTTASTQYELQDVGLFEFVELEYSVYFPKSFNVNEEGEINIEIPFTICNLKDDGKGIDGFINLDKTVIDLSPAKTEMTNDYIWSEGKVIFQMSIGFDNYLIKIDSSDRRSDTKYISPR